MSARQLRLPSSGASRPSDPWLGIPLRYNLGWALTRGLVEQGRGEQICLYWENSAGASRQFTYREMDEASSRLASSLRALGVGRGDRVFLRLPNLPEFYLGALAAAKLGAIFIPSSTQFRAAEVAYRLRDSGAVVAITTTGLAGAVEAARESAPTLRHLITVEYAGVASGEGQLDFWQLVREGDPELPPVDTAADDFAFIAYTSGTTGDPKGVVHYQRYPVSYESLIHRWHHFQPDDICACPAEVGWLLPVASTFLYAMRMGMSIVLYHPLDSRFVPADWFRLIAKYRISNFVGTPTMYRMLTADASIDQADLSSLRHGTSAGEPLAADTLAAVERYLGFTPLDGIGMSECMVYCFNSHGQPLEPGSCGFPDPGCEMRILDESLAEVPDGQEGVLCLRRGTHPGMMHGYWGKPQRTEEVFRGRWYYSGDVLVRDADGRYWFKGRADDVIKASGYRISPFEIEACLAEHPHVLESAAVASPDETRGEVVKAFVLLRAGISATEDLATELQQWVKSRLAPYKYPRKVEFVSELPKTQSGKIKRRELRAREFGSESGSHGQA